MDSAPGSSPAPPQHLRWDVEGVITHACTLAAASATPSQIQLHFGRVAREAGGAEVAARVCAFTLSPLTARNLAATLRRLIEEHDGGVR